VFDEAERESLQVQSTALLHVFKEFGRALNQFILRDTTLKCFILRRESVDAIPTDSVKHTPDLSSGCVRQERK